MAKQGGGLEGQLISGARFAAGPVVPIGSIASAGFEKGQKRVQAIQQAEFEKKKLEAQNYAKQQENTNKILDALYKNKEDIKVNGELLQGYWKQQNNLGALQVKPNQSNLTNAVRRGALDKYTALTEQDRLVNDQLNILKKRADNYSTFIDAVDDIKANLSSTVSSKETAIVNGIMQGDEKIINQVAKQFNIKPDEVLDTSILKKIGYVASDYSGAEALFTATQQAAQKAVNSGLEIDGYKNKVQQDLSLLMNKMSDEQIVSTAFDFLGKETPGYTSAFSKYIETKDRNILKNFNEDDPDSMENIRRFVYDNFLEAAEGSYVEFRKGNEDKFKVKDDSLTPSKAEIRAAGRAKNLYNDIKSNPKNLIDEIFPGSNYTITGNVVQFFDITKDGEKVKAESYDLNSPAGTKGLLSNMSQAYFGTGGSEDLILDEFDKLIDADKDFDFSSKIFPTTKPNLP